MQTCELLSKEWEKSATEIFQEFLELMNKYADYFFSQPWPKKYDHEEATTFTDEDVEFLSEGGGKEASDRLLTVALKKNLFLDGGFMGYFGIFWTQQAFHDRFIRPQYKPILETFDNLSQKDKDARTVLTEMKKQFNINAIHDSLVDLLEQEYPEKTTKKLIEEIFVLLHTDEGLPLCGDARCSWYWKQKYPPTTNYN